VKLLEEILLIALLVNKWRCICGALLLLREVILFETTLATAIRWCLIKLQGRFRLLLMLITLLLLLLLVGVVMVLLLLVMLPLVIMVVMVLVLLLLLVSPVLLVVNLRWGRSVVRINLRLLMEGTLELAVACH
jgi:hypothetical protein